MPDKPWELCSEGRGKDMEDVKNKSHCPWSLHGARHAVICLGCKISIGRDLGIHPVLS